MDNYHITKNGDKWQFKKEGAKKALNNAETKEGIGHNGDRLLLRKPSLRYDLKEISVYLVKMCICFAVPTE